MTDKGSEPRTERHFYSMPVKAEMFLPALACIQDYHKWLAERGVTPDMVIHSPNPELDFLMSSFPKASRIESVVREVNGFSRDQFEQSVLFDPQRAYRLSEKTHKHAAQVFGIMVGSDPPNVLPVLDESICNVEISQDIAIAPFSGASQVFEFFCNNKPELRVVMLTEAETNDWNVFLQAHMTIALRSGLTYLAAAAKRAVVEIYSANVHRDWLSKWGNNMYQMIYGDEVRPELVFRAALAIWKKVEQRQRAMVVKA